MREIQKPNKEHVVIKFILIFLCGLNMAEDGTECESFTVISIDFLLLYENKYYMQVCLESCAYKIVEKQMINYYDENLFETDKD